jgi:hypothetical protein
MNSAAEHVDFFFGQDVVGYFANRAPTEKGQYPYMPYRGIGHYRLEQALTSIGPQKCHYVDDGQNRAFTVIEIASYGVLEVAVDIAQD